MAALAAPAAATPINFDVSAALFTPGSGYGTDADETDGTLLGMSFSTSGFSAQNFNLDLPSPDSSTFLFGSMTFSEPNSHGGINSDETDNLGVTATFTINSPTSGPQVVTAVGTATTGSVSDAAVDYTLVWTPIVVSFGLGGQYQISLSDMSFSGTGTQNVNATITLLSKPEEENPPPTPTPEPASMLLFGTGLAGLLARRRFRRAK